MERNGNRYVYRSTSIYDPNTRKKKTVSEYVGRLDPHTGEIIEKRKNKKSGDWSSSHPIVRRYGACHVLASISESEGLTSDVVEAFGPYGRYLVAAAISLILNHDPQLGITTELESNMSRQILGLKGSEAPWISLDAVIRNCEEKGLDDLFRIRIQRAGDVVLHMSPSDAAEETSRRRYSLATDSEGMPVYMAAPDPEIPFARDVLYTSNAITDRGAGKVTAVLVRESARPDVLRYLAVSGVPFLAVANPKAPLSKNIISTALKDKNSGTPSRSFDGRSYAVSETTATIIRNDNPLSDEREGAQMFSFVPGGSDDRRGIRVWACIPSNSDADDPTERLEKLAEEIGTMTSEKARTFITRIDPDTRHYLDIDLKGDMAVARIRRKAVTASRNRQDAFVMLSDSIPTWEEAMGYYGLTEVPQRISGIMDECLSSLIDPTGKLPAFCDTAIRFIALNIWLGIEKLVEEADTDETVRSVLRKLDTLYAVSNGESWTTSQQSPDVKKVLRMLKMSVRKVELR